MTKRTYGRYPDNLKPGIYRVFWRDGGASIAAVGVGSNGDNWIAPTNWIEPVTSKLANHPEHPEHWSWKTVKRVEFVTNDAGEDDEEVSA